MYLKKKFLTIIQFFTIFFFPLAINQYYANQGLFPMESFAYYDIPFRILKGDVPFLDFWVVSGIFIDYIQSLFVFFLGKSFQVYVLHASLFNSFLTLLTFYFLKKINVDKKLAFYFSLLFCVVAYPSSGTLYVDHHASLLCLAAIYFFIIFFLYEKKKNLFISLLILSFSFLTKAVPAAYVGLIILLFFFIKIINEKKFFYIKDLFFYSLSIFVLIIFFMLFFGIPVKDFVVQYLLFPITIGKERYLNDIINFGNLNTYKFIFIPFVVSLFLVFKKNENIKKLFMLKLMILIFLSFILAMYLHQVLTKNQEFIFFVIPILMSLIILQLRFFSFSNKKVLNLILIIFCSLVILKYHLRFNENRKFHELENINLEKSLEASMISPNFKGLRWITSEYPDNPEVEINNINNILNFLKQEDLDKSMLITNYPFFSSLLDRNINTPGRWFVENGGVYPIKKNNIYFSNYKNFLIKLIDRKKINKIYIISPIRKEVIFRYINIDCFFLLDKIENLKIFALKSNNCNLN